MKTMKFFFLAAAVFAAISCVKENLPVENENPTPEVELVPMTFTASYAEADDAETKVAYEGGATVWEVNDKIMLITSDGTATEFTATSVEGNRATFEGLTDEKADSYYAVSPASAYVGNDVVNGMIYANIPQNQTAVAGSFDRKAFLSVASNKGSELYFMNSCSVVGFKLSAPAGVKSVRFTATDQTNLAGTGVVKTDKIPTHAWDGTYEGRSAFDMITLNAPEGGFLADTDYYLTIRANTCPKGINVYVEYEDQVKSRNSENPLFPSDVHPANMIRNLGQLDKNLTDITPYDSYQMGFDLVVGDKVYNKATHTFELITASKANDPSVRTKIHDKEGKFYLFLDSGEYNFELGSYTTIRGDVVMIGVDPVNPAKVTYTQISRINSGSLVMSNLDITPMSGKQTIETTNATDDVSHIVFNKCKINNLNNNLVHINNAKNVNDIQFNNCDIQIDGGNAVLVKSYTANQYANISYVNNVIYNAGELNANFKLFCDNQIKKSTISNCTIDNNTFVNTYANTTYMVYTNNCSKITLTDNLMYFPNEIKSGTGYLRAITSYPVDYTVSNNIAFSTSSQAIRYFYDNSILSQNTNTVNNGINPFNTYDLATGVFVQADQYKSYGATR